MTRADGSAPVRQTPSGAVECGTGPATANQVFLSGTVTSEPETKALPSGSQIVAFRVSVRREPTTMTRGSRQTVDVVDCCAWSAAARRSAGRLEVGDSVEVAGFLRRRFYRTGAGTASRVEVEVSRVGRRAPSPEDVTGRFASAGSVTALSDLGADGQPRGGARVTGQNAEGLRSCPVALSEAYDVALLDLDGVVYIGPDAVPGATDELMRVRRAGMRVAFATNNASRPPEAVAAHLSALGIDATAADVVTSAQAVAGLIAERFGAGTPVFVMGGAGLVEALRQRGLVPVQGQGEEAAVVVSGYHPDLRWGTVVEATIRVGRGVPWYASNTDMTLPTPEGLGPGSGALVQAVSGVTGRRPVVAGKPEPTLFEECVRRTGASRPLVVGDRLDTDIEGAQRAGMDSLLVLTGVTGLSELTAAQPHERPSFLGRNLDALLRPQPLPRRSGEGWGVGGWQAHVSEGRLWVSGEGDPDDWWRVVAQMAWEHLDSTGRGVDTSGLDQPG